MGNWIFIGLVIASVAAIAVGMAVLSLAAQRRKHRAEFERAQRDFRRQREHLEAEYYLKAAQSGKPRGLRWKDCEFTSDVLFARDRKSAVTWAFAPVTLSFEAIEGGPMEGVEAVGNLRAATAVFRWQHAVWSSDGRTLFNLEPAEAIRYFQHELELESPEVAAGGRTS